MRRKFSRMARRAAPYVKTGYKVARNLATDYRKYKAAGQSAGTGTTRQHDAKVQYRKKRMPYRKKKKWISHVKKVKAVLAQDDGTKTVLFNAQISSSTSSGATRQNYQFHCLYGCNGSASVSEIGSADLEKIFTNATVSAINTNKLMFKSAVMDMTIANTGTVRCELDLYHLTFHGRTLETSMNACAVDGAGVPLIDPNSSGYFTTLDLVLEVAPPLNSQHSSGMASSPSKRKSSTSLKQAIRLLTKFAMLNNTKLQKKISTLVHLALVFHDLLKWFCLYTKLLRELILLTTSSRREHPENMHTQTVVKMIVLVIRISK